MRKDFYIFRHGETELNRQNRWQGSGMNYDLTELGKQQADDLAAKLANLGIEIIFSSPLVRALHTAAIVAKQLEITVQQKDDLRECFYGKAEGMLVDDLTRDMPDIVNNWYNPAHMDIRFPEGESKREALERVLQGLQQLSTQPFAVLGIAIHGGSMGALLNYFGVEFKNIPNCASLHLVWQDEKMQIEGGIF